MRYHLSLLRWFDSIDCFSHTLTDRLESLDSRDLLGVDSVLLEGLLLLLEYLLRII